eukprot:s806_g5.t1
MVDRTFIFSGFAAQLASKVAPGTPALVAAGSEDPIAPRDQVEGVHKALGAADPLLVFEGGHEVTMTVLDGAKAFLAKARKITLNEETFYYDTNSCPNSPVIADIEEGWYAPDDAKHCFFHTRGYEMFQAARTHGGCADLARIFMSCNKEPSKIMHIGTNPLSARDARAKISY